MNRYYQCEIAHVTLPMFCHWLERDWGWQIFDLPSYAWPELRQVDHGHADEFECYYDVVANGAAPSDPCSGRIWLAHIQTDRLYVEVFVREEASWARRLDIWLQQRYDAQLSPAKRKLMIAPAPHLRADELKEEAWRAAGYCRGDYFDWWYRGGRLYYPTFEELAGVIGVEPATLHTWHEEDYRRRYGPQPKPDSQSHFSGIL
jgi:hypothetical protein